MRDIFSEQGARNQNSNLAAILLPQNHSSVGGCSLEAAIRSKICRMVSGFA